MMKFYTIYYMTYHNGKRVDFKTGQILCDESKVDNWRVKFTWENLTELYEKIGCHCCFNIWDFKRGRLVSFFNDDNVLPWSKDFHHDVKEWKTPDLDIEVECEWVERHPSLDQIFEWHDGEKAMKYLLERGITMVKG